MLEVLNKRKKKIDMENFKRINPFWTKDVVKNQRSLFKWLARFSYNDVIKVAPVFNKHEAINYNDYLAFVNNANTLIFVKTKKMTDSLKVINKFRRMLGDYGVANAFYSFFLVINDFFAEQSLDISFNKREYLIKKYNEYIDEMWDRFKKEYLEVLAEEPNLKEKANEAFNFDKQVDSEMFFPKQTLEIMLTFLRKAVKNKKATEKQFNTTYLNALFFYYYMYAFHRMFLRLLINYPDPKRNSKKYKKMELKKKKQELKEAKQSNKKDSLK